MIMYLFYVILENTHTHTHSHIRAADYTRRFWIGELSAISSMEIEPGGRSIHFRNDTPRCDIIDDEALFLWNRDIKQE